jgi:hypothetical protein
VVFIPMGFCALNGIFIKLNIKMVCFRPAIPAIIPQTTQKNLQINPFTGLPYTPR